jgi:hypothetical protein
MEKTLSQKEVIDFVSKLDYQKMHAAINNFLFDARNVIIENNINNVWDFEVFVFENFKTQLLPRIELLLVANVSDFEKGIETPKVVYSTNSFGYIYKTNDYKVDSKFGLKFSMIKFLTEVNKENIIEYYKTCLIPAQFKGDDGEDYRLDRMELLTIDTYDKLK